MRVNLLNFGIFYYKHHENMNFMKVKDLENSELQYFYGTYLNALNEEEDLKSALENGKKNFQQLIENLIIHQIKASPTQLK